MLIWQIYLCYDFYDLEEFKKGIYQDQWYLPSYVCFQYEVTD